MHLISWLYDDAFLFASPFTTGITWLSSTWLVWKGLGPESYWKWAEDFLEREVRCDLRCPSPRWWTAADVSLCSWHSDRAGLALKPRAKAFCKKILLNCVASRCDGFSQKHTYTLLFCSVWVRISETKHAWWLMVNPNSLASEKNKLLTLTFNKRTEKSFWLLWQVN